MPFRSIRGEEVPHAGPPAGYRLVKDLSCHLIQLLDRLRPKNRCDRIGMYSDAKQNFVGVDIPDAGDGLLVHQQGLEPTPTASDNLVKSFCRDRQRIMPKTPVEIPFQPGLIEQRHATEAARIPVTQLLFPAAEKGQPHMNMLRVSGLSRWEQKQAGHAELGDDVAHLLVLGKSQRDALTIASHCLQPCAGVPAAGSISFAHDVGAADPQIRQRGAQQTIANLPRDDFGFRKFRHISKAFSV